MDEHSTENLFTLESKPVPLSLIAVLNKLSLPISNSLSEYSTHNQDKLSQNYFEGWSLSNTLKNYEAKTIVDTTSVGDIHTIVLVLETNDSIVQQIAEIFVLLPMKDGRSVANSIYYLKDGPLGFSFCINLQVMSTFCGQRWLS